MAIFVLDTDHVTLLQRGHAQVVGRIQEMSSEEIAASIVTYEEQLRGRLAVIHKARTPERLSVAYLRLREMHVFFCSMRLLDLRLQSGGDLRYSASQPSSSWCAGPTNRGDSRRRGSNAGYA